MELRMKTIAALALAFSCLAFTLASSAKPSYETEATTIAAPASVGKKPNCNAPKGWDEKSYCFAREGAKLDCREIYGADQRKKCRTWYLAERFQPWPY